MRILIIEPIPLLLESLQEKLPLICDLATVHAYKSLCCFEKELNPEVFDIVWMDSSFYKEEGKRFLKGCKQLKIILFGNQESILEIRRFFAQGIAAYLPKTSDLNVIKEALAALRSNSSAPYLPANLRESCLNWFSVPAPGKKKSNGITRREQEILNLIVQEYTTNEIAQKLFLSCNTIETHRINLIHKMGVKNTAGLVRVAVETGMYG